MTHSLTSRGSFYNHCRNFCTVCAKIKFYTGSLVPSSTSTMCNLCSNMCSTLVRCGAFARTARLLRPTFAPKCWIVPPPVLFAPHVGYTASCLRPVACRATCGGVAGLAAAACCHTFPSFACMYHYVLAVYVVNTPAVAESLCCGARVRYVVVAALTYAMLLLRRARSRCCCCGNRVRCVAVSALAFAMLLRRSR